MVQFLIASGSEADATSVLAGLFGARLITTADGRSWAQFNTDDSGIPSESAAFTTLIGNGDLDFSQGVGAGTRAALAYEDSVTAADGSTTVFAFPDPVRALVAVFLGGIPQFTADVSIDESGQVVLGAAITPPAVPVSALFYR
jgi:hypothetical protein